MMKALPPAMSKQGSGLAKFIGNPSAITKAMDLPASQQIVDVSATDVSSKPVVAPKALPAANLVPDPVAAFGKDAEGNTIYDKEERIRQFKANRAKRAAGTYVDPPKEAGDTPKVDKLEDVGIGEKDVKEKVKKDLEDNLEIDPKMKKAFMDALALPAKSAAVAMTDLLEKIPAPSKEASKILNRNISKISNSFKLGAASAEVANDEEDNDNKKEGSSGSLLGTLVAKAFNFVKGKVSGGGGGEGEGDSAPVSGQPMLPPASGDPTHGRRAPYTGTADGIGLGDGSGRAMQPIKKRKSAAAKLFGMTPMGMAFNAGTKIFQGAKGLAGKASGLGSGLKGIAGKAFSMTPMGIGLKLGMKAFGGMKNIFAPKDEQTVNLTELTDKTIQENRESADSKTEKQVALAAGVTAGEDTPPPAPSPQEGSELAQPDISDSPYLDVYNTTSQF